MGKIAERIFMITLIGTLLGFGVKNIKSVVKDYGGEVSFNVLDDMFSVSVIIPIEI